MKKAFYILLLFSCSRLLVGQTNLVPNPSFETLTQCPQAAGNMPDAAGWFSAAGTPDYFNSCASSTTSYLGTPCNFGGCQYPYDGNGYAGLATYSALYPDIREYISIQLSTSLTIGVKYYVSAFISRSDSSWGGSSSGGASNKFGFKFSTISKASTNAAVTDNFSHIVSDTIFKDKINWTQIAGSFIADSLYNFIIIGNFYNDANTTSFNCPDFAYYYLDMVCVSTNSTLCNVISGVNEFSEKNASLIYPNPTTGHLFIKFPNSKNVSALKVIDKFGQIILNKRNYKEAEIDLSSFSDGIYFIEILSDGKTSFDKIMIRH